MLALLFKYIKNIGFLTSLKAKALTQLNRLILHHYSTHAYSVFLWY